jgi:hypothetical protein
MKASLSHWASRLLHCEEKPSSKGAHTCSLPVNARALVFFSLSSYVSHDVSGKNSVSW